MVEKETLLLAHKMLPAIIQHSHDAIITKDIEGIITDWNPAAEKMFQYTAEEAIGKNIALIIPSELMEEEAAILEKIRSGEAPGHFETIRYRKDKSRIEVSVNISPLKNEDNIVIGASTIIRDISGQNDNERKQALLAAIVDSSDDAIVSKNLDGIILTWNRGAENIFEYNASEAIGKHISLIIPPEKMDEEAEIIASIKRGERVNHIETVRLSKSGRPIHVSVTISPIEDSSGKIIGASKVARDITEKVRIEQEREYLTNQLQLLNNYKDDFMAMASHELKTPITVINANLQVLKELITGSDLTEFVVKSLSQVKKLNHLINDLFDVSKLQKGILQFEKQVLNYNTFLRNTVESFQSAYSKRDISLDNLEEDVFIYADELRIEQVISNLLMNAIKYSPTNTKIWISCSLEGASVKTVVRDQGIGLAPEEFEKIFERFYRVKSSSYTYSGSGIGLYISSEIVKRHNGRIWVESNKNGSTFYFTLPLAEKAIAELV